MGLYKLLLVNDGCGLSLVKPGFMKIMNYYYQLTKHNIILQIYTPFTKL